MIGDRVLDFEAWPTPGHASHHVSFLSADGSCYSGDATGVVIAPATYVAPVAPPPDIDVEAWEATIDSIEERKPVRSCLRTGASSRMCPLTSPGYGPVADVVGARPRRCDRGGVRHAATADLEAASDEETAASYLQAAPLWQSYAGLRRYWEKQGIRPGQGIRRRRSRAVGFW